MVKLLHQSPDGATVYSDTGQTIMVLTITYTGLLSPSEMRDFTRRQSSCVCVFVCLFVRLFVCLSPVNFLKSFARWQHLEASGGLSYRLRYTCFLCAAALWHTAFSRYWRWRWCWCSRDVRQRLTFLRRRHSDSSPDAVTSSHTKSPKSPSSSPSSPAPAAAAATSPTPVSADRLQLWAQSMEHLLDDDCKSSVRQL